VPSDALRTFRIAAADYVTVAILPHLIARLTTLAPQIDLRVFPFSRLDVARHLDDGRIDLVIGWFGDLPDRTRRATVLVEKEAIVVRPGHPLTEAPITKERLLAFPHIVVELTGTEEAAIDGFFDDRGVWRRVWIERLLIDASTDTHGTVGRVAISVPHYAAVPPMLRVTDMVATLPRSLARLAVGQGALVMLDLPYEPLAVPVEAVWHQRGDRDGGLQWLISVLIDAMQSLEDA
jgi:DNA-binding transcriptional LysR family regulator